MLEVFRNLLPRSGDLVRVNELPRAAHPSTPAFAEHRPGDLFRSVATRRAGAER